MCFTGGHIGKWLPFTSGTEFEMAPHLKVFVRVQSNTLQNAMLLTQFEQFFHLSA